MAHELVVALSMILAAAPVAAAAADQERMRDSVAPAGGPETRYCLRVEAATGSRIERVMCWTREEWAAEEVDVDKEWAREGVRVLE